MSPVQKANTTRVLGAPIGWDEQRHGKCEGLPIVDSDGVMYSYWRLSWMDRFRIMFGRNIRLAVVGSSHPPVAIDTEVF
jgi:hypothetical protein